MLDQLPKILRDLANKEADRLWSTVSRLVDAGTSIQTDGDCLRRAAEYRKRFALSQQDSIIYSAIIADLQRRDFTETKCFMSGDAVFKDPDIITELNSYNCRYERTFGKGLSYIRGFI